MNNQLYDKKIECPICNRDFTTKKVRTSSIRITKRDEDFCPHYESENPLFYSVFVCPNCGYAALESQFLNINYIGKEKIKSLITSKWGKRSFGDRRELQDAIDAYKLALICHQIIESPKNLIANICLRIAWFYRYGKDPKESEFLNFALDSFEEAYTGERLDNEQEEEIIMLYLAGELSRRLGKYENAIKWFDKTLKHEEIRKKRHIQLKAREQWALAREEYNNYKSKIVAKK